MVELAGTSFKEAVVPASNKRWFFQTREMARGWWGGGGAPRGTVSCCGGGGSLVSADTEKEGRLRDGTGCIACERDVRGAVRACRGRGKGTGRRVGHKCPALASHGTELDGLVSPGDPSPSARIGQRAAGLDDAAEHSAPSFGSLRGQPPLTAGGLTLREPLRQAAGFPALQGRVLRAERQCSSLFAWINVQIASRDLHSCTSSSKGSVK